MRQSNFRLFVILALVVTILNLVAIALILQRGLP